jgi:hypothetical protein
MQSKQEEDSDSSKEDNDTPIESASSYEPKSLASYLIFKLDVRLFKFRGDIMPKGQYRFPFTFKVPKKNVPSTFKFISDRGDCYSIKYTVEVYFNDSNPLMS